MLQRDRASNFEHRAPSTNAAKRRKRGGQPGNLNAMKHGRHSRQVKDVNLALEGLKRSAPDLYRIMRVDLRRRDQMARSLHIAADLLLAYPRAGTIDEISPFLIQKAAHIVKNQEKRKDEATNRTQQPLERLDAEAAQTVE